VATVPRRHWRLREFQSKFYSRKVNDYKNGAQFFSSFKLSSVIISRSPGVSTAVRQLLPAWKRPNVGGGVETGDGGRPSLSNSSLFYIANGNVSQ
jgi:hypothetical protein